MKVFVATLAGFLVALLYQGDVFASGKEYQLPRVEYSADSYMETEVIALKAKIYYAPDKERREQEVGGEKMTMITRSDKKVIWTLMPDALMYMEMKITEGDKGAEDLSEYKIEETVVGEDVVNGIRTTKSKLIMTSKKDGSKMGGFWWTTKEGIMVKMEVIAVDKNSKTRIKTELTNLKIGKQDPNLFEIPAGYSKMSMPFGIGGTTPRAETPEETQPESKEKPKKKGLSLPKLPW